MINYIQLVEDTEDGKENPFKAMAILNELQKEIKEALDQIKPIALEEADKYEKTFEHQGLKIERRNGRQIWNFKNIEEWNTYDKAKKECEDRLKTAWKAYQQGSVMANEESGEVSDIPEVTYASDVLVIKTINGESLLR